MLVGSVETSLTVLSAGVHRATDGLVPDSATATLLPSWLKIVVWMYSLNVRVSDSALLFLTFQSTMLVVPSTPSTSGSAGLNCAPATDGKDVDRREQGRRQKGICVALIGGHPRRGPRRLLGMRPPVRGSRERQGDIRFRVSQGRRQSGEGSRLRRARLRSSPVALHHHDGAE